MCLLLTVSIGLELSPSSTSGNIPDQSNHGSVCLIKALIHSLGVDSLF